MHRDRRRVTRCAGFATGDFTIFGRGHAGRLRQHDAGYASTFPYAGAGKFNAAESVMVGCPRYTLVIVR